MRVNILQGVTVIECSTFVTGPYATSLLGDLGARIIKIESPPEGDPYRYFAPDPYFSPNFAHLNRNKESLVLNLKNKTGREIAIDLAKKADVFVENFRPGTVRRLGLGYETLKSLNPRLVYCSISAFGQTGPYAGKPGFDTLGQAMSGLLGVLTDLSRPQIMGIALADYLTGLSAGYGILGALLAREKTGVGSKVETSLLQATLSLVGETAAGYLRTGEIPNRMARVKNAQAFAFLTKDKLPLVIHCSVPEKFWVGLLKTVGRVELGKDPKFRTRAARRKNYDALRRELSAVFSRRTRDQWLKRLEKNDVPAAPLYNMAEALADPQVKHLGLVDQVKHPMVGLLSLVEPPVTYKDLPKRVAEPPPLLGEHTDRILNELGWSQDTVKKLAKEGIVKT